MEIEIGSQQFMDSLDEHLDQIRSGTVFLVDQSFVIGPPETCNALGLVDEEYGWPALVSREAIDTIEILRPGHRRHPIVMANQQPIAASISLQEWAWIKELAE